MNQGRASESHGVVAAVARTKGGQTARRLPTGASTGCSPRHSARRLWPRRDAEQQHFMQGPDVIRQASGHRGRPLLPALDCTRPVGRIGQRHAQARVGRVPDHCG